MSGTTTINGGDGAGLSSPDDLFGDDSYQAAVAHQKYRLAKLQGDESGMKRAAQNLAKYRTHQKYGGNSQLRKDEWKRLNQTLVRTAQESLVGIQDLRDAGLAVNLDLGVMRYEWEDVDEFSGAAYGMAADETNDEDSPDFTLNGTPLPIAHKGYTFNLRKLRASRNRGQPIDTTAQALATRQVAEKLEDVLFNGDSTIQVDGDGIDGYTTHTDRETVTGNATWDGATADNIIDDVMRTVEALEDANQPPGASGYTFYIARQNYQEARAKNAGTDDKKGVLEHLVERFSVEEGMPDVRFRRADKLTDGNAVAVKMSPEVVELAIASDIQNVEWDSQGGMRTHAKVLGSMTPVLKSDSGGNMGVAHLSSI